MAITDSEAQDLLDRARTALQQGDKATARDLLIRLLEQDDRNARAWLLLSGAVDAVEEQRICLENVLTLEPSNNAARQGLEYLNKLHPQVAGGQPTTTPSIVPATPPAPAPAPVAAAKPPQSSQTFAPTQTPQPFTPIAADDAIPTFVPATPYSNGADDLTNFPGIEPFIPPGFEVSSADSGQSAPSAGWPQPSEVVDTQSEWPTTRIGPGNFDNGAAPLAAPDDPWAELRANMQPQSSNGGLPTWASGSEATTPSPNFGSETPPSWDSVTPSASNNHFGEAGMSAFPTDVQPFQYDTPGSDSLLSSADMTSLPDWAVTIDTASGSSAGSLGESSSLPSWALPSSNGAAPDMGISSNGASPSAGLSPAGPSPTTFPPISESRSTTSPFTTPVAPAASPFGSSPFGLSAPAEIDNSSALNGTELPPDSPWAGTFGGGLGLGAMSGADGAAGQQNMGDMSGANFQFGAEDPGGSSPSLISRPPISSRAAHIATGFSCPNCGEVAFGNALSCARCQFRFYAACPKCGEFLDTTDPDPGGDSCPKCGRAIDKLELGRNELPGKRPVTTREAIIAQIPTTRPASELAASQAIRQAQTQSHTRTLIGLLVVIALLVFLFYFLPGLLENSGINLVDSTLNISISTPTP